MGKLNDWSSPSGKQASAGSASLLWGKIQGARIERKVAEGRLSEAISRRIKLPRRAPTMPLGVARDELRKGLAAGETMRCPLCSGTVKVYARPLRAVWLRGLAAMAVRPRSAAEMAALTRSRDYPALSYWGLAVLQGERWHITVTGREFLAGREAVPHKALTWQGDVIGFDRSRHVRFGDLVKRDNAFSLGELLDDEALAGTQVEEAVS